jgi:hypothetical protein
MEESSSREAHGRQEVSGLAEFLNKYLCICATAVIAYAPG